MNIAIQVAALASIFLASCVQSHGTRREAVPEEDAGVTTSELKLEGNGEHLTIHYHRGTSARHGPRVVELFIRHSDNLRFESVQPGAATINANKQVLVREVNDTALRALVFSPGNANELSTGLLCTLQMQRTDEHPARAEILLEKPLFAPAAALDGLAVSDPVVF